MEVRWEALVAVGSARDGSRRNRSSADSRATHEIRVRIDPAEQNPATTRPVGGLTPIFGSSCGSCAGDHPQDRVERWRAKW
jgi:hypothetical protein